MDGLCPAFKHVEAFGDDAEYEEDVEVSYVTLDLGNNVDKALLPNTSEYRLIGLDTATPMLQLSGLFFKGTHEQLIGTEILFADGRDDANLARKFVVPVGITEQRIQFEQVDVVAKGTVTEQAVGNQSKKTHASGTNTKGRGKVSGRGKERGKARAQPTHSETAKVPQESPLPEL